MQIIHRDFSVEKFSFLSRKSTSLNLNFLQNKKKIISTNHLSCRRERGTMNEMKIKYLLLRKNYKNENFIAQ